MSSQRAGLIVPGLLLALTMCAMVVVTLFALGLL